MQKSSTPSSCARHLIVPGSPPLQLSVQTARYLASRSQRLRGTLSCRRQCRFLAHTTPVHMTSRKLSGISVQQNTTGPAKIFQHRGGTGTALGAGVGQCCRILSRATPLALSRGPLCGLCMILGASLAVVSYMQLNHGGGGNWSMGSPPHTTHTPVYSDRIPFTLPFDIHCPLYACMHAASCLSVHEAGATWQMSPL